MGVIAVVMALLSTWLNFKPKFQLGISILSGLGSLGYGFFWLIAGYLAPSMGSTGAAKASVSLLAQVSGASFFLAGAVTFTLLVRKVIFSGKSVKT